MHTYVGNTTQTYITSFFGKDKSPNIPKGELVRLATKEKALSLKRVKWNKQGFSTKEIKGKAEVWLAKVSENKSIMEKFTDKIKVASQNINGKWDEQISPIQASLEEFGLDILCLQEIKVAKEQCPGKDIFEGYTTTFNLLNEEQIKKKWVDRKEKKGITAQQCEIAIESGKKLKASEGMATIIASKWSEHIDIVDMDSLKSGNRSGQRVQITVIKLLEERALMIVNIYAPCGGSDNLEIFLEDLENMLKETREKYKGWNITTIRMGDFNAITSNRDIRRSSNDTDQSSQTRNIDEYMNSHKLACGLEALKGERQRSSLGPELTSERDQRKHSELKKKLTIS